MFTTCSRALAQHGRMIVIGMMSQYTDGWAPSQVCLSKHVQRWWSQKANLLVLTLYKCVGGVTHSSCSCITAQHPAAVL
jgi:NADPH-dependent curcumin reductase CurA